MARGVRELDGVDEAEEDCCCWTTTRADSFDLTGVNGRPGTCTGNPLEPLMLLLLILPYDSVVSLADGGKGLFRACWTSEPAQAR